MTREDDIMITIVTKMLIAAALLSLVIIACDMLKEAKMNGEHSVEFVESKSNMRCVLVDGQEFCASSRMREPIETSRIAVL